MRATVGAQDLVVWRAGNGEIAAWDNRCPHRGMALSHGFVRGNHLACLYHGWHYDGAGACSYIPAHPDLEPPATIRAARFSVQEAGGVIWVRTDGAATPGDVPEGFAPLRVFVVAASEAAVERAALAVPFEGRGGDATGNGMFAFGDVCIALLCNALEDGRTQVTALASPGLTPARMKALSRWCEALRRAAEAEGVT